MSPAKPRNVPRIAGVMDLGGLALLLIGVACYFRAYVGLSGLRTNGVPPGSARFAGLAEFDRYYQLSRLGLGIAALAIVVFIAGAVVTWRARRAMSVVQAVTEPVVV